MRVISAPERVVGSAATRPPRDGGDRLRDVDHPPAAERDQVGSPSTSAISRGRDLGHRARAARGGSAPRSLGELERGGARAPAAWSAARSAPSRAGEELGRVRERPARKTIVRSPSRQVNSRSLGQEPGACRTRTRGLSTYKSSLP